MGQRSFIIGGSGLLGLNWAVETRARHSVTLGLHKRDVSLAGVASKFVDCSDIKSLVRTLSEVAPDYVINASGMTDVALCETYKLDCELINARVAENIAIACNRKNIPLIQISTDHLTNGKQAYSNELCMPNPVNQYARSKHQAELAVLANHNLSLVLRTNFFGYGTSYRRSFSDLILGRLSEGENVRLASDLYFTPVHTSTLISVGERLIQEGKTGIFNVSCDERVTKYKFGVMLANRFGFPPDLVFEMKSKDLGSNVNRPLDMSLSNVKLKKTLNIMKISIDSQLDALSLQRMSGSELELRRL